MTVRKLAIVWPNDRPLRESMGSRSENQMAESEFFGECNLVDSEYRMDTKLTAVATTIYPWLPRLCEMFGLFPWILFFDSEGFSDSVLLMGTDQK